VRPHDGLNKFLVTNQVIRLALEIQRRNAGIGP
jgi:hypothetical protein